MTRVQRRWLVLGSVIAAGQWVWIGWLILATRFTIGLFWAHIATCVVYVVLGVIAVVWELHANLPACPDQCPHCRYSRRGNKSGICPECGRQVKPDPWLVERSSKIVE